MKIEGINIFYLPFRNFKRGAALTIPGVGIFIGKNQNANYDVLRHEFGHILQYRKWGFWVFWLHIAWTSLLSATRSQNNTKNHMNTWTEWSANRMAYIYFQCPTDWNMINFPISPQIKNKYTIPSFASDIHDFICNWIEAK